MQAFQEYSAGLRDRHRNEYARRVRAGEFKDSKEKLVFLSHFRAVLAEAEAEWKLLQVSVIAGGTIKTCFDTWLSSAAFTPAHSNVTFQLFDMFIANDLYQLEQMRGALTEPDKRLFADLEMFRVPRLHIGFIDRIEPSALPMMIAWKRVDQSKVLLLGKRAEELDVVGGRPVVRQCEKDAGIGLLNRLMQKKRSSFCKATIASVTEQNKELSTCLEPFPAMLPRDIQPFFRSQQLRLSERLVIQFV